jgi:hypothetical protein
MSITWTRGRHPTANDPRRLIAEPEPIKDWSLTSLKAAAATAFSASVKRSTVRLSTANDGRSAPRCQAKRPPICRPSAWNGGRSQHRTPVLREGRKRGSIRAKSEFIWGIPDQTKPSFYMTREHPSKEMLIHELTDDFQRIQLYANRGFITPQEIPEKTWNAFKQRRLMGYRKTLV